MKKGVQISDSEWEVMAVLWEEAPLASTEVVERIQVRRKWSTRTIRTLIDRLLKKGALQVRESSKRNVYSPALNMAECLRKESRNFIARVFGGNPASMLLHVVKDAELSPEEIQKLKRLLSEKEKEG